MEKILLAIDGNSLMHRAFWALPQMTDSKGRNTNAVYGFFTMLFKMTEELKPTNVIVAFDKKGGTFRHKIFEEYKAGRKKTPPELNEQFGIIRDALSKVGIEYVEIDSFEADDILGTLSVVPNMKKYIVTGDRDALQLISPDTKVVITKKGVSETVVYDEAYLKETLGITPSQIVDLKALMGDSSDNIPGVAGVGEKTALKLLAQYPTLEELYENFDALPKNKLREKLEKDKDSAFMSKTLATINKAVPLEEDVLEKGAFDGFDREKLGEMCAEYDFKGFMKRFGIEAQKKQEREIQKKYISAGELERIVKDEFAIFIDGDFHIAVGESCEYIIKIKENMIDEGEDFDGAVAAVCALCDKKIIGFDVKSLMHRLGTEFACTYDIMIADWVLDPSHSKAEFAPFMEKNSLGANAADMFVIKKAQEEKILACELEYVFYKIEMPLMHVLYNMEKQGFCVSREELLKLKGEYEEKINALTSEIYLLAGSEFNINSPKQLGKVLFEDLKLPVIKKKKTGYSTDIEVLEKLAEISPVAEKIIEFRQFSKLKSTYVDGLLNVIKNGRVHTTFLQTATQTGRLSSVEPNLQNIPIKSEMANDIRRVFTAPKGYKIISADYSQIELRLLAHIADDEHLKDAFIKGQDIHARTASQILKKPIEEVTPKERSEAKAVNFGIVYGISDFGLAKNIGISRFRAKEYIEGYLKEFSGVKKYMDDIVKKAHEDGCVRTMWGRVRYLPELSSGNYNIRSFGERAALNTPIQGSAADIIKIAMIKVYDAIKDYDAKLILQVHDELILYVKEEQAQKVAEILRDCMEHAARLNVPLTVSAAQGDTWAEAK